MTIVIQMPFAKYVLYLGFTISILLQSCKQTSKGSFYLQTILTVKITDWDILKSERLMDLHL